MANKIYKALVMNPVSADEVRFGNYLAVSNGKIVDMFDNDPSPKFPGAKFITLEDRIIIPGLVDTHVHLPQYPNIGIGGELELMQWLEKYTFPTEKKFSDSNFARVIAKIFFRDLVANGTTAASVFVTIHENATSIAFEEAQKAGLRANIGKVMMDRNAPEYLLETLDDSVSAVERLARKWDGAANGRLHYVVTPRFAITCTPKLLRAAAELSEKLNLRIQTHLSENKGEIEFTRQLFPNERDYTSVYQSAGLVGKRAIMAHSIHLSPEEIQIMKDTRTGIAHCPCSNIFLNSGIMPYSSYKSYGLIMGLGSDISGGCKISMLGQMLNAIESSKVARMYCEQKDIMKITDAFYLATLGGARVLALDEKIGNFEPGKDADFVILTNPNPFANLIPNKNPDETLAQVCYLADQQNVQSTYVQGKRIYTNPNLKSPALASAPLAL